MRFVDNKLLLEFAKSNKKILAFLIFLSCVSAIKGVYFPVLISELPNIFRNGDKNLIFKKTSFLIGIFIGFTILSSIYRLSLDYLGTRIYNFFFKKFLNTTINNLEKNFTKIPTSDFYSNILKYVEKTKMLFYNLFNRMGFLSIFISTSYFFGKKDFKVTMFFMIVNIILLFVLVKGTQKHADSEKNVSEQRDKILNLAEDINTNIPSVTSFNNVKFETNNIIKMTDSYTNFSFNSSFTTQKFILSIKICFYVLLFGIFSYFYKKWQKNQLAFKELISIILIIFSYLDYLWIDQFTNIPLNKGIRKNSLNKLNLYYKNPGTKKTQNKKYKNTCQKCILSTKNISYYYPNGKKIFDKLNLNFYPKQIVSVIGKNGSGKSTLIKILFGMIRINMGEVFVFGFNTSKMDIRKWRKYIHYCQQNPVLFNRTVDENLFYNNRTKKSHEIIKELGLSETVKKIKKTQGPLGISGTRLSGGQRQIIALLRIILKPKPIILLDEPTSALDSKIKITLYNMIKFMKKQGSLVIVISHDKKIIDMSDRTIELKNGQIIRDQINKNLI